MALSSPGIATVALGLGTTGPGSSDPGRTTRKTTRAARRMTPPTSPDRTTGLPSGEAGAGAVGACWEPGALTARRTVASSKAPAGLAVRHGRRRTERLRHDGLRGLDAGAALVGIDGPARRGALGLAHERRVALLV